MRFVGVWGQRHLQYLKEYRRNVYLDLMMSGRLNSYLADIEEQAQERFERIVEQMKQAQGITEQLKANNTWEWVGRMNNIQACAREIVDKEIIYHLQYVQIYLPKMVLQNIPSVFHLLCP